MLRYLTAGESHGKCLATILEGIPAGLKLSKEFIDGELRRRQSGYGRGKRMEIEEDEAEILSGVRGGETLGSPITLLIRNRDWENWQSLMDPLVQPEDLKEEDKLTKPRPGHADLAGAIKYSQKDLRNILERSSARETAARVAVGAVANLLLQEFEIEVVSQVVEIGGVKAHTADLTMEKILKARDKSKLGCADKAAEKLMIEKIEKATKAGDSLGGIFEVVVANVPIGLGSHVHWDRKLDGRLAQALMSIQAIKGVEIGLGFESSRRPGSNVHDEIYYESKKHQFYRKTNRAGGIEGGTTNGELVVVRAAMKPIPTLKIPLQSVDIVSKDVVKAAVERSDVCAVPAATVVGEAAVAFEMAKAMKEKFGGDSLTEMKRNYASYMEYVSKL
ncbi:chorismate synthase [bacterium]|nr:chorismate synthase [bacterium]MCK4436615.1 chorismate synthase [bacterium]